MADRHLPEHAGHRSGQSLNQLALTATVHCLTGCAIGEVLGLVLGTALGWSNARHRSLPRSSWLSASATP